MKRYSLLVFYLPPDSCASNCHTSLPDNHSIRIELKLDEALAEAVTVLLFRAFDASIQIDTLKKFTTYF